MLPQIVSTDTKKTHVNRRVCKERAAHLDALDDTTALGSGLRLHAVEGGSHVVENLLDLGDGEFNWWYERNHLWEEYSHMKCANDVLGVSVHMKSRGAELAEQSNRSTLLECMCYLDELVKICGQNRCQLSSKHLIKFTPGTAMNEEHTHQPHPSSLCCVYKRT